MATEIERRECVIGIDPGDSGAIVVLNLEGKYMDEIRLNKPTIEIKEFLVPYCPRYKMLVLEKVKYRQGDGGKGAFTFGYAFGKIVTILEMLDMVGEKVKKVIPTLWRTRLGFDLGASKKALYDRVRRDYPDQKVTLKNADAFLLARYGINILS